MMPMCLFTWPAPAAPTQCKSTLPSQWTIGGQGPAVRPPAVAFIGPLMGPPSLSADGGSCARLTSKNTSKNELGAIAGTLNVPMVPKSGRNTPKSCENNEPEIGPEACGSGFVQRT